MNDAALQQERNYLAALAEHAGIRAATVAPPQTGHVTVQGMRLRYLDWGGADAPPLVLLHGGGQSAHTWDACCLALAGRYRCIAIDQRGHGDSDWADTYAIGAHVQDIAGVIDALCLRAPIVAGMSMGGINGLAYAARHPGRLRALVCIDVGPEVQPEPVQAMFDGLADYRYFSSPEDAAAQLSRRGARRPQPLLQETLRRNLRRLEDGRWTWKYDPRTIEGLSARSIHAARQPLWHELHRIACPTLVVRGADSAIFAPEDADKLTRNLPHATSITVPRAGHSVQTDNPLGLARAIAAFDENIAGPHAPAAGRLHSGPQDKPTSRMRPC